MSALEKQIATALTSDITASDLATLVTETEAAINEAEEVAKAERVKALDPLASPDAVRARAAMENAAFTRDRLRTVLPRLQQRHREVAAAEELARWLPQHDVAEARRNGLALKLHELYLGFVEQFVPLLDEIEQADREIRRVNDAAPSEGTTGLYLRSVEEEARGANNLMRDLRLPAWQVGSAPLWPRLFNPALFTPAAIGDPRQHSGDWWKVKEEEAHAVQERQERDAAEEEAKARANWRGPRWWEGERA